MLDRFDDVAAWKSVASDGVTASLQAIVDGKRQALRLDFDLGGTAGYAVARRALPIVLPENYAITFWLRADAPVNDLQVKLADASGDNVWWYNRPNFAFPREWQQVTIKKRQIEFAWGPTKDRALRAFATIEIAVAAGSRRRPRLPLCQRACSAGVAGGARSMAGAEDARVVDAAWMRIPRMRRWCRRDRMAQQSGVGPRAVAGV